MFKKQLNNCLRPVSILYIILFTGSLLKAQTTIEAGIGPLLNTHFISSDNFELRDSLKSMSKPRVTFQGGIRINSKAGRNWNFQTGIGYARASSKFERTGLGFHDSIHTEIGRIEDLSQAATKTAIYRYNFDLLDIPLNFLYRINVQKGASFFTPYFILGVQNHILLNHHLRIDLEGFTIDGENKHKISRSGWHATDYSMLINTGARFELKLDKKTKLVIQPEIKIPTIKSTKGDPIVYYLQTGLWLGISRSID